MRHVVPAALMCLALLAAPRSSQGARLAPVLERAHELAVCTERTAVFLDLWLAAGEERRDAAEGALRQAAGEGRPLDARPTPADLTLAARVLSGADPEAGSADELARFADALDLRIVPGAVSADEARGASVTVYARRIWPAPLEGALELALSWRGPDGEEIRARNEPFAARDFTSGFPLYLRAPARSGTWRLVPEVRREGRSAQGAPTSLAVVEDLDRRLAAVAAESPEGAVLQRLLQHGVRPAGGRDVAEWFASGVKPSERVRAPGELGPAPAGTAALLLVVAPLNEAPDGFLRGAVGDAWRRLAEERRLVLVPLAAQELRTTELDRGLAELSHGPDAPEVVLVARGDACTALHLASARRAPEVDALVLVSSMERLGPVLPQVRTLLVGTSEVRLPDDPAHLERVRGGATPLLSEPLLPALVERWLMDTR